METEEEKEKKKEEERERDKRTKKIKKHLENIPPGDTEKMEKFLEKVRRINAVYGQDE